MIPKPHSVSLVFYVSDIERTEAFYRDVLGPALVIDLVGGGIDDIVAALAEKGVTIVTPVSEAPGGWSADFLDPDGFGLGLWQSGELPRTLK